MLAATKGLPGLVLWIIFENSYFDILVWDWPVLSTVVFGSFLFCVLFVPRV